MYPSDIKLLVGLGNPGSEYKETRHNIGFMVLEELAKLETTNFRKNKKLFGSIAEIVQNRKKIRLLMPDTYMNNSGRSIRSAIDWFGIEISQVLVLVDDMDLPLGKLRLRAKGGSGGHNGLKSIIQHLGSQDFCRLRIGIGPPTLIPGERKEKTIPHVLGKFSSNEIKIVSNVINEVKVGLNLIQEIEWEKACTHINSYTQK